MTKVLQQIITKIEKLSEREQNAFADLLVTELERESIEQKSGSLDDVINLVDQWLVEDGKYDEDVYSQLEVNLLNNSVSIKSNL